MTKHVQVGWTADDQVIFDNLWGKGLAGNRPAVTGLSILVWNKIDLASSPWHQSRNQAPPVPTQAVILDQGGTGRTAPSSSPRAASSADFVSQSAAGAAASYQSLSEHPNSQPSSQSSTGSRSQHLPTQHGEPRDATRVADSQPEPRTQASGQPVSPDTAPAGGRPSTPPVVTDELSLQDPVSLMSAGVAGSAAGDAGSRSPGSAMPAEVGPGGSSSSSSSDNSDNSSVGNMQPGVGENGCRAYGLPARCVEAFAACVETCATSGLGLDALSAALLKLSDAPNLAAGKLPSGTCMKSHVLCQRPPELGCIWPSSIHTNTPSCC